MMLTFGASAHTFPPAPPATQRLKRKTRLIVKDMEKLQQLKEVMDAVSKDSTKFFEKGNKAAGTRARKNLQELKKLAQELRVAIQDTKANMANTAAE
ncbi:hypothetical protein BWQ96_06815 [Gracilariopsis chorda]|uniref:Histone H1 n=1 Tax=Gracilariopsis chorda TaxID=448386 RepID=A0A2V3IMW9_9FLOR|nr:hypothetical protein BWQ96_06815 [Gracilariopsis chorda]|eukprot:PXF43425.1 hypothetical protein BWQ96_06815 [Gracilariopsis chorda]